MTLPATVRVPRQAFADETLLARLRSVSGEAPLLQPACPRDDLLHPGDDIVRLLRLGLASCRLSAQPRPMFSGYCRASSTSSTTHRKRSTGSVPQCQSFGRPGARGREGKMSGLGQTKRFISLVTIHKASSSRPIFALTACGISTALPSCGECVIGTTSTANRHGTPLSGPYRTATTQERFFKASVNPSLGSRFHR